MYVQKNALELAASKGVTRESVELFGANAARQPSPALFHVGALVRTTTRMQQGVNQPGGVATVTKVSSQSSGAFYNVKYNDSARAETHLPESTLSTYVIDEGRPRRSQEASFAGESIEWLIMYA